MEDRLLILQIAFSMVADSPYWENMLLDARVEEVSNVYRKLNVLVGEGVDTSKSEIKYEC